MTRRPRRCTSRRRPRRRSRRPRRRSRVAPAPASTSQPALRLKAACKLAKSRKAITCAVSTVKPTSSAMRLSGTVRLAGRGNRASASKSGKGKVNLTVRSAKRLKKGQKVVLTVRGGSTTKVLTVKAALTQRGAPPATAGPFLAQPFVAGCARLKCRIASSVGNTAVPSAPRAALSDAIVECLLERLREQLVELLPSALVELERRARDDDLRVLEHAGVGRLRRDRSRVLDRLARQLATQARTAACATGPRRGSGARSRGRSAAARRAAARCVRARRSRSRAAFERGS